MLLFFVGLHVTATLVCLATLYSMFCRWPPMMSDRWQSPPASTHPNASVHAELKAVTFDKYIVITYDKDSHMEKILMKDFARMYDCGEFKVRIVTVILPPPFFLC